MLTSMNKLLLLHKTIHAKLHQQRLNFVSQFSESRNKLL